MALKEFARGLKTGLVPYIEGRYAEKAANKEQERKFKYLKNLTQFERTQKQIEHETQLERIKKALSFLNVPEGAAEVIASSPELAKYIEVPLGEREKTARENELAKFQAALDYTKAQTLTEIEQAGYYSRMPKETSAGLEDRFKKTKFMIEQLENKRKQFLPHDEAVGGEWKHVPGDPERVKFYDAQIRKLQASMGYDIPEPPEPPELGKIDFTKQTPQNWQTIQEAASRGIQPARELMSKLAKAVQSGDKDAIRLQNSLRQGTQQPNLKQDRLGLFQ